MPRKRQENLKKAWWKLLNLAAACSTLGFCVATG